MAAAELAFRISEHAGIERRPLGNRKGNRAQRCRRSRSLAVGAEPRATDGDESGKRVKRELKESQNRVFLLWGTFSFTTTDVVKHVYRASRKYEVVLIVNDDYGGFCKSIYYVSI